MNLVKKNIVVSLLVFSFLFLFSSCISAINSNVPELEAQAKNIKKIVLLPPEINVCELTAGGVKERREQWCETGKKNVEKALAETLKKKESR